MNQGNCWLAIRLFYNVVPIIEVMKHRLGSVNDESEDVVWICSGVFLGIYSGYFDS
jgi:hypothetical protein